MVDQPFAFGRSNSAAGLGLEATQRHLAAVSKEFQDLTTLVRGLDLPSLEKVLRHTEVDREEARQRAEQASLEKQELERLHAGLEAQLREALRSLEEANRTIQHQKLQIKRLQVRLSKSEQEDATSGLGSELGPDSALSSSAFQLKLSQEMSSTSSSWIEVPEEVAIMVEANSIGIFSRRNGTLSKGGAAKVLKATQEQLKLERQRKEKLALRYKQERDRADTLQDMALSQHQEIVGLRKKLSEVTGVGNGRLPHHISHTGLHRPASVPQVQRPSDDDRGRVAGALGRGLAKQLSASMLLPAVA